MKKYKKVLSAVLSLALTFGCLAPAAAGALDLSNYDGVEKNAEKTQEVIEKAKSTIESYSGFTSDIAEEAYRNQLIDNYAEKNIKAIGRIREGEKWYETILSFQETKGSLKEYDSSKSKERITYVMMSQEDYNNLQNHPDEYKLDYIDNEPVIIHDGKTKSLSATPSGKTDEVAVYAGDEQMKKLEGAISPWGNELTKIDDMMTEDGYWNISEDECIIYPVEKTKLIYNGKSGNDTYRIRKTKGIACIHDYSLKNSGDSDTIIFDYDASDSKVSLYRDVDDLYIIDETNEILVYIQKYFTDSRVEYIKISEDVTLEFDDVYILTDIIGGTDKNDNLKGYVQPTLLLGYSGNDTITASNGDNYWAFGDDGDDNISVPFGNAMVWGGDGSDVINITKSGKASFTIDYDYGYNVVFAGDGNDTVSTTATLGENLIIGGVGDDTLKGGFGDDVFVYNHGDGNDKISESCNAFSNGGTDYIYFADLLPEDVYVRKDNGFTIYVKDGCGSVNIPRIYQNGNSKYKETVEYIVFADDTIWNLHDILEQCAFISGVSEFSGKDKEGYIILGTDGDDKYTTGNGDDVIRAGKGNDYINAGGGKDTVIFCRGDGHDVFDEKGKGADTLIFEDIKSDEVRIARFGSKLTINVNGSDDALELPGIYYTGFSGPLHHVEKVHFADGVVWTFDEMLAMARVEATDGDDTIIVPDETHIVCCGKGNDTIIGTSDGETYLYGMGDGHDVITDKRSKENSCDTICFGEGINPETLNVNVNRNTIVISIPETEDSVTLTKGQLERFSFTDGTSWTESDLLERAK